jgi:hypothetical protein
MCFCCDFQRLLSDVKWRVHRGLIEGSGCLFAYQCRDLLSEMSLIRRCQDYASMAIRAR